MDSNAMLKLADMLDSGCCMTASEVSTQLRTAAAEGGEAVCSDCPPSDEGDKLRCAPCPLRKSPHAFVGDPNSAGHVHYCLKCNAVEGLDTTPAECTRPDVAAYCDPTNPFNGEAFSWPGTARDPEHTTPLCLHPPTDSGAGRDGEFMGVHIIEDRRLRPREMMVCTGGQQHRYLIEYGMTPAIKVGRASHDTAMAGEP